MFIAWIKYKWNKWFGELDVSPPTQKPREWKFISGDRATGRTTEAAHWAISKTTGDPNERVLWFDMSHEVANRACRTLFNNNPVFRPLSIHKDVRGFPSNTVAVVFDNWDNYPLHRQQGALAMVQSYDIPVCWVYTTGKKG